MRDSLNTYSSVQLLLATPDAAIQEFLARNQTWIEAVLGCRLSATVTFEFHLPFCDFVMDEIFQGIPIDNRCIPYNKLLRPFVTRWELPPDASPRIELNMSRKREGKVSDGAFGWDPHWRDTPIAVWLTECNHAIVSVSVP